MSDIASNDYISQINRNGSGLNIPQIVGAIVDADIDPIKNPVVARQEKVETAISGLAQLKQSSELTKTNISKMKGTASFYSTTSSDANQLISSVTNQALVKPGTSKITDISQLAQAMSFSVPAPGSTTAHYTAANAGIASAYSLTIKVGGTYTDNADGTADVFDSSAATTTTLNLNSGESIASVAQKLDAITGLNAKVVMVGTSKYKIVITGETGKSNAFEISTGIDTGNGVNRAFDVWHDSPTGGGTSTKIRDFDQAAKDLKFKVDGLDFARESNTVTDVIPGISFEAKVAGGAGAEIKTALSKTNIQETVQGFVDELNAYKADLRALSFTDTSGAGEHGDLFGDDYVKSRLRALADFMLKPINGYGSPDTTRTAGGVENAALDANPVYLAQLGFKTETNGTITFDQRAFDSTFTNSPDRFAALIQDRATSSEPDITVIWASGSTMPAGVYDFTHENDHGRNSILSDGSGDEYSFYVGKASTGTHNEQFLRYGPENGTYTYSKPDNTFGGGNFYSGFSLRTSNATISNDREQIISLGKSFTTLFAEFHDDILNNTYEHRRQVETYQDKADELAKRLSVIELRSNALAQSYNSQFQAMESNVTGFNSTGDMLTNYVAQWNKS